MQALPHLIEELEFAVGFQTQALAFDHQECLGHFASARAPRIIAEVFDSVAGPGKVLRLEQLAIDLGPVYGPDLEEQWEQRLRLQLYDALSGSIDEATAAGAVECCSTEQAAFEAFWYFLQHGRLPWHGRNGDAAALTALAHAVASHSGERLARALRDAGPGSIALRRLVLQLPAPALGELVGRWLGQGSEVAAAIERVTALCAARGISELARLPLRTALWEAALARLLGSPAQPSDAVIETLAAVLADSDHEAAAPVIATLRAASPDVALQVLRTQLREGLLHDPDSIADSTWEALLLQDAAWLRTTLAMHGCSARVRRTLAARLTPARLWSLAALWLPPEERDFVWALVNCPALRAAQSLHSGFDGWGDAWGCTLSYLWTGMRSSYSRQEYVAHLLRQLHAADATALVRLQQQLLREHAGNAMERALHALLTDAVAQVGAEELQGQGPGAVAALRTQLLALLLGEEPGAAIPQTLLALLQRDPAAVATLLRGADAAMLERLLRPLPTIVRRRLFALWLTPSSNELVSTLLESHGLADLLRTIGNHDLVRCWVCVASHVISQWPAFDPAGCIDAVLAHLLAGQAQDPARSSVQWLTTLQASAGASYGEQLLLQRVQALTVAFAPGGSRTKSGAGAPIWMERVRLEAALTTGDAVSAPQLWQRLLREDAAWLKAALQRLGRTARVRRQLARELPQSGLQQLAALWLTPLDLSLLAVLLEHHRSLQQATRRRLWEHVLAVLLLESRHVATPTLLVEAVLRQVAAQTNLDWQQLVERLATQLRNESRTDGTALLLATLDALACDRPQANWDNERCERKTNGRNKSVRPESVEGIRHDLTVCPSPLDGVRTNGPRSDARPLVADSTWVWRIRLESALTTDSIGTAPMWETLLTTDAAWLKEALQRLGRSASVRRRMALGLPKACLHQLSGLWLQPSEQDLLDALLAQETLLEHATPRQLWELAFGTLVLEHARTPAVTVVIHGVLQQLAARAGLDQQRLREQLQSAARAAGNAPLLQALTRAASQDASHIQPVDERDNRSGPADAQQDCLPEVLAYLQGAASSIEPPPHHHVTTLLTRNEPHVRGALRLALETRSACERLIDWLPEPQLQQVLQLLQPWDHLVIRSAASCIVAACRAADGASSAAQYQRWSWQFILRECCEEGRVYETAGFAVRMVEQLARWVAPANPVQWRRQVQQRVSQLPAREEPQLQTIATALAAAQQEPPRATAADVTLDASSGPLYIANAGLVLASAYLPRLFAMLKLTNAEGFIDAAAAQRAVHLTQYVVSGGAQTPEYQLLLNKLLCGVAFDQPLEHGIEIQPHEHEAIEGMLRAMIQHWKILGHTSIAGLRETFLQREGQLLPHEDQWQLLVEPRPFDMLLDHLPWGYATIKFPWMPQVLHVEWR